MHDNSAGLAKLIDENNPADNGFRLAPKTNDRYTGISLCLVFVGIVVAIETIYWPHPEKNEQISSECVSATTFTLLASIFQTFQIFWVGIQTCRLFYDLTSLYTHIHASTMLMLIGFNYLGIFLMFQACDNFMWKPSNNALPNLITFVVVWDLFLVVTLSCVALFALGAWIAGPPTYHRKTTDPEKGTRNFVINFLQAEDLGESFLAKQITANGGRVAMAAGPGRNRDGIADLAGDLHQIRNACGENTVLLTLFLPEEMNEMSYPKFLETVNSCGISSVHFPIRDKWFPESMAAFLDVLQGQVVPLLLKGHTIVVHCYGGKGRTAVMVGGLLILLNTKIRINDIVTSLRYRRPGMLKNPLQRFYLLTFRNSLTFDGKKALQ